MSVLQQILLMCVLGGVFAALFYRFRKAISSSLNRNCRANRIGQLGSLVVSAENSRQLNDLSGPTFQKLINNFKNAKPNEVGSVSMAIESLAEIPLLSKCEIFGLLHQPRFAGLKPIHCKTGVLKQLAKDLSPIVEDIYLSDSKKFLFSQGLLVFAEQEERLSGLSFIGYSGLLLRAVGSPDKIVGLVVICISSYSQGVELIKVINSTNVFDIASLHSNFCRKFLEENQKVLEREREISGLLHDLRASNERAIVEIDELSTTQGEFDCSRLRAELIEGSELSSMVIAARSGVSTGLQSTVLRVTEALIPIIERFSPVCRKHNKTILLCGDLDLTLLASSHVVKRVVSNFLMNSIRYSKGSIISIDVEGTDTHVKIRVLDEGDAIKGAEQGGLPGIGIASQAVKGSGIGLDTCEKIAKSNSGYTWYAPRNEIGSVFGVAFPRSLKVVDYNIDDYRNVHILLIDDDEAVLDRSKKILENLVGKVGSVGTLEEARAYLLRSKVDCVVSDFHLGGDTVDGLIREQDGSIPFIIYSGGAPAESFGNLGQCSYLVYLEKPVSKEDLSAALRGCLGGLGEEFVEEIPRQNANERQHGFR